MRNRPQQVDKQPWLRLCHITTPIVHYFLITVQPGGVLISQLPTIKSVHSTIMLLFFYQLNQLNILAALSILILLKSSSQGHF